MGEITERKDLLQEIPKPVYKATGLSSGLHKLGISLRFAVTFQFSSVAQLCLTLCNPMDCSTPGFPVYHQLPEPAQIHVHCIGDAIQPPYPLSYLLLPPSIFLSIRVFSSESVLRIRWPKYWSFSFNITNEHSGLISFRKDLLDLLAVQGTLKSLLQNHGSKYHFFGALLSL